MITQTQEIQASEVDEQDLADELGMLADQIDTWLRRRHIEDASTVLVGIKKDIKGLALDFGVVAETLNQI
jgi:hypothetical protein